MTTLATPAPSAPVPARIQWIGTGVLVILAALVVFAGRVFGPLQAYEFDAYQRLSPREVDPAAMRAVAVEIDEQSLQVLGSWPWPRTQIAQLIDVIARQKPAAIGLDILMPEADPYSPQRWLERMRAVSPDLAATVPALSTDAELARTLSRVPSVLAFAGSHEKTGLLLHGQPIPTDGDRSGNGAAGLRTLTRFEDVLNSREELEVAARGHGLVSVELEPAGGVVRNVPLVAIVHDTLVPAMSAELLGVAKHAPMRLVTDGSEARALVIGDLTVPTEPDGTVRPYYSTRRVDRIVSARDIIEGHVAPDRFTDKLVLVGLTGVGLLEYKNTPLGIQMPGVEIHAQLLENLIGRTLLSRPAWAAWAEGAVFLVLGALLVYATPRWKPRNAALLAVGLVASVVVAAYALFRGGRVLIDAAVPALGLILLFGVLLVLTLAEATRQRRALEAMVQAEREHSARMTGEMQAAQRVQTANLPSPDALAGDPRIDLAVTMVPARVVGGDLYDFYRLDDDRLFFIVGDVAGKGLPASIFMAVSKALYKSTMLREPQADLGEVMAVANAEISRDNSEMLFVTALAAIVDLARGELSYCNAGQDNPFVRRHETAAVLRLGDGGGPPLCTVDAYAYRSAHFALQPGDVLCVVSDGVTEARDAGGTLYGERRVREVLARAGGEDASSAAILAALRADLEAFAGLSGPADEPDDDATILVLRWRPDRAARPANAA
jgi:CHASE2 domain-containing sensor protein/serine phosphatase RsbU (regulator of sigma subunit)